jgi:hypothetical protein
MMNAAGLPASSVPVPTPSMHQVGWMASLRTKMNLLASRPVLWLCREIGGHSNKPGNLADSYCP